MQKALPSLAAEKDSVKNRSQIAEPFIDFDCDLICKVNKSFDSPFSGVSLISISLHVVIEISIKQIYRCTLRATLFFMHGIIFDSRVEYDTHGLLSLNSVQQTERCRCAATACSWHSIKDYSTGRIAKQIEFFVARTSSVKTCFP